ncbi:tubby C-terminal-like domain-containing protein [Aspergillus transmontanensis]|uniref:Tubby C-terminal-like domain-containing protein n=1 Tax=Aspergillus transmontanensis TaxID=1034304 RepID=A0A5N6VG91_9EURO|nr:tubby C-terminal-like domain-containing protein [Aspergillus transmontanensis]
MASSTPITLKKPIAIRPEHIASCPTTIKVKQHSKSWSGGDFTISTCKGEAGSVTKLFSVDGDFGSLSQRRHFRDSSGLPLFELHRKKSGVTWFVHLPGDKSDAEPIATIATKWSVFKDKFDVHIKNAAAGGEDTVIEVRGQDIWKVKTHVYNNGALVMIAKLTDVLSVYVPGKRPEWELTVAEGLDLSLASIVGVLLATLLKYSSMPSSYSPKSQKDDVLSVKK